MLPFVFKEQHGLTLITDVKGGLQNLPAEIRLHIIEDLDPASSTCLGVTCKAFYNLYWVTNKKVPLNTWVPDTKDTEDIEDIEYTEDCPMLAKLLKDWVEKSSAVSLMYDWSESPGRFLTIASFNKSMEEHPIRQDHFSQAYSELQMEWPGIALADYDPILDEFNESYCDAEILATWEYEDTEKEHPGMGVPTDKQIRRSERWQAKRRAGLIDDPSYDIDEIDSEHSSREGSDNGSEENAEEDENDEEPNEDDEEASQEDDEIQEDGEK